MFLYFCVIEHTNSRKGLCGLLNEQKGLEWNVLRTRVLDCGRVKQRDCGAASRGSALKCVSLQKETKKLEVQEADEVTVHVTQWLLERGFEAVAIWSFGAQKDIQITIISNIEANFSAGIALRH